MAARGGVRHNILTMILRGWEGGVWSFGRAKGVRCLGLLDNRWSRASIVKLGVIIGSTKFIYLTTEIMTWIAMASQPCWGLCPHLDILIPEG